MNKKETIKAMVEETKGELNQKQCELALKAFEEVVGKALENGDKVALTGFMTIETKEVAERECLANPRQPELGKKVIPAHKGVRVKIGKGLKDKLL
ncbi:HU family DNA-binding protein [Clostridium botulinum]|uniref:HU family DNA-binding protein n=1 Tax=Clostridium botulinum TaxID=1491 RepID=UPI0007738780|nr:HU family DNA-binding protein [Clostridium botulinum]APH20902.1 DNA-binding protein HU [Clostridium botulinum]APQ71207.1 DNA-binding protein HU [Clostridium botulinum]MBN3379135.1 DNA-binding protein [Clostridium botulinum]MBY6842779.1 HU family DNA-binding protein [Clostridium botulinum]